MDEDTSKIIKHDLDFVIDMFKKYNTPVLSWYWRNISETEEQWLIRRTKLAISKKKCSGIIHVDHTTLFYDIKIPFTWDNEIDIYKNKELHLTTKYENLYSNLEEIIKSLKI